MKAPGGPLRFLIVIIGGWATLRIVMLLPTAAPVIGSRLPARTLIARAEPPLLLMITTADQSTNSMSNAQRTPDAGAARLPVRALGAPKADPARIALALLGMVRFGSIIDGAARAETPKPLRPADFPPPMLTPLPALSPWSASRWSGSAWLAVRGGQGLGAGLTTNQIGGNQAGMRLAYALDSGRRLAVAGRFATPLGGRGKEAAIGLEWQPTRLPVRLIAEQRIAIDRGNGGSGPAIGMIGGFGPSAIGRDFRLEAYGQAGAIKRRRVIGYVDGAIRLNRQIALVGDTGIDVGAGSWGAAQPGAARLDMGPSIGVRLPINGDNVRLSLDWRQRVAGNARPGSGATFTIGADF